MSKANYPIILTGSTVRLPERRSGDGTHWPEEITVVTQDAYENISGIRVCRVERWPGTTVRVDALQLINQ